jgi:23S rRNA-/tRNA-specific pseudouridylate synthase
MKNRDYLVLNKPAGFVVHPGIGHEKDTLANYVKQYLIEKGKYDYGNEKGRYCSQA